MMTMEDGMHAEKVRASLQFRFIKSMPPWSFTWTLRICVQAAAIGGVGRPGDIGTDYKYYCVWVSLSGWATQFQNNTINILNETHNMNHLEVKPTTESVVVGVGQAQWQERAVAAT